MNMSKDTCAQYATELKWSPMDRQIHVCVSAWLISTVTYSPFTPLAWYLVRVSEGRGKKSALHLFRCGLFFGLVFVWFLASPFGFFFFCRTFGTSLLTQRRMLALSLRLGWTNHASWIVSFVCEMEKRVKEESLLLVFCPFSLFSRVHVSGSDSPLDSVNASFMFSGLDPALMSSAWNFIGTNPSFCLAFRLVECFEVWRRYWQNG